MMFLKNQEEYPDSIGSGSECDEQDDLFRNKVNLLWEEECLVDVSLACENKVLTAHKLVLSAYSDYFKEMFVSMKNVNQYPIIFMRDVSYDILKAVLEFMYRGEVNVPQNSLHKFMKTVYDFRVKGINISEDFINELENQPGKRRRSLKTENQGVTPPPKKARGQRHYSDSDYDGDTNSPIQSYEDKLKLYSGSSSHQVSDAAHHTVDSHYSNENDGIYSSENLTDSSRRNRRSSEPRYSSIDTTHFRPSNSRQSSESRDARHPVEQQYASVARQHHVVEKSSYSPESRYSLEKDAPLPPHSSNVRKHSSSAYLMPERAVLPRARKKSDNSTHSSQSRVSQGVRQPERKGAGVCTSTTNDTSLSDIEDKNYNETEHRKKNFFNFSRNGNYKREDLMVAIGAIRDGMSLAGASKMYSIPSGTLSKKYKLWRAENDSDGVCLEKECEEKLVQLVEYMTQITPLTSNQVKMFAWAIDSVIGKGRFGDEVPNNHWWAEFMRKNPNIITLIRQYDFLKVSQMKSDAFSFKALGDYLVPVQEIIEAFDLNDKPENFWSCSEYLLNLTDTTNPDQFLTPARTRFIKSKRFSAEGTDTMSIMFAGSAAGKKVPPFVIMKDAVISDDAKKEGPAGACYNENDTGFMDSNLILEWFQYVFLPQCPKNRSVDSPVILLLNSSFPLAPQKMLDMAFSENVILLSLMPHLHHACQPMDAPVVKGFAKSLRETLKRDTEATKGKAILRLPKLIKGPFEAGITNDMIMDGFHICGVFPLTVNVDEKEYLELCAQLNFDTIPSCLRKEAPQVDADKLLRTQNRKIKILQDTGKNTSSDEDDLFEEESNCCYVCGKDPPEEGTDDSTTAKWAKCSKRFCKNLSCDECLPFDLKEANQFVCIDCNQTKH